MKKLSLFYAISYFLYTVLISCNCVYYLGDYLCAAVAVLLALYQLFYVAFLCRIDNVSHSRSAARGFLYILINLNLIIIIEFIGNFINGYQKFAGFPPSPVGEKYYGFEAIINDDVTTFIFGITFPPLLIYSIIYAIVSIHLKKKRVKS